MAYEDLHDLVEIGRGGFGVVYKAKQRGLNRDIAVKVLQLAGTDERAAERFQRETAAMGAVAGHPHIMQIHEAGKTVEGRLYMIMPLANGGSMWDRFVSRGPAGFVDCLDIGVKMAGALATAHRAGIVHRDVKPDNILFDMFGEPVLTDFGISSIIGSSATKTGEIAASIAYAPPEVLDGQRPDVRADVYSLACTLWAALLGRSPFSEATNDGMLATIARILTAPPPALGPDVPDVVVEVLELALAKDRDERLDTALDLGEFLRDAQEQLGLTATPLLVLSEAEGPRAFGDTPGTSSAADVPPATDPASRAATTDPGRITPISDALWVDATSTLSAARSDVSDSDVTGVRKPVESATKVHIGDRSPDAVDEGSGRSGGPGSGSPSEGRRRRKSMVFTTLAMVALVGLAVGAFAIIELRGANGTSVALGSEFDIFIDRIDDPMGLSHGLGAQGGLDFTAKLTGLWWGMTDYCVDQKRDRLGGCYDRAADYLTATIESDPRTVALAADADRASVRNGLAAGYDLALEQLDRLGGTPPHDELVAGRPGFGLLCMPDCVSIQADLVAAAEAADLDEEAGVEDAGEGAESLLEEDEGAADAGADGQREDDSSEEAVGDPGEDEDPEETPDEQVPVAAAPPSAPVAGCPFDTDLVVGFDDLSAAEQDVMAPVVQWASTHNARLQGMAGSLNCAYETLTGHYRSVHRINRPRWDTEQSTTSYVDYRLDHVIQRSASTAIVDLTFVSAQSAAYGFEGQTCTQWSQRFRMVEADDGTWRFDEKLANKDIQASGRC